jgi:hypothetical protein
MQQRFKTRHLEAVITLAEEMHSVLDDPEFGKEVLLRFSDGTQLSIAVGVRQTIDARYCQEEAPDTPISHKQAN